MLEKLRILNVAGCGSERLKCLNFDGMKKKGKIAWLP